ncbi:MAG TPA: YkgJ family cysteine cluster protein [Candidatus Thermoplasmatota archaeon]|nr:YkgJ family cysteine cluster protein [Candidatus Thermoplasmatota archaeon]
MTLPDDATLAALGRRVDFRECGPCGGACCRMPWTVFVTPRDVERLERATGRARASFARLAPLPAWEREAFGEGNLLFTRVALADGRVPQLLKREDGACVFLDAAGGCGVHASKPLMCRLFPFYYEMAGDDGAFDPRERPSPAGTRGQVLGRPLRLLVDRGHEGRCPIATDRIAEVEREAGDAALALAQAFEEDLTRFAGEKEAYAAQWKRPGRGSSDIGSS